MLPAPEPSRITLDGRIDLIARQPFRATFHLRGRGLAHAQHATATCCRSCLGRNHAIERELG